MLIVITHGSGQLGNRLIQFGNILAYAMEHGHSLVNLGFTEYQTLFTQLHRRVLITYPALNLKLPHAWLRSRYGIDERLRRSLMSQRSPLNRLKLDYELPYLKPGSLVDIEAQLCHAKILTVRGLKFQHPDLVEKHGDRIRSFLALRGAAQSPTADGKIRIGLHIRQGDYKNWRKGQFFFTLAQYRSVLERLVTRLSQDFVIQIYSNGTIDLSVFQGLPVEKKAGDIAADLQSMAQCDFLLGPPSSFSLWASFIGQVPLYFIEHPTADPSLPDFVANTNLKYLY
jgi:hypothetical protein